MSSFEENTSSLVRAMHSKRRHSTLLTPLHIDSLGDAIIIIITIIIAVQFQGYVYFKKKGRSTPNLATLRLPSVYHMYIE